MGFFDRLAKTIGRALESVSRVFGGEPARSEPPPAPTVIDVVEREPERAPSITQQADELRTLIDEDDAREQRRELAEALGPPDETELGSRSNAEIELEQWLAWIDANAEHLPPDFRDELIRLASIGEIDLDEMYFTTTNLESPSTTL